MLLALPDVPLRTAPFSLPDRWLVWSRARLYADRLTLSGWGLGGRYWRRIPLDAIDEIEQRAPHLALHLETGRTVVFTPPEAARWETSIKIHSDLHEPAD